MKQHILGLSDVAPAIITFDGLILDPELPLEAQAEWELKEDLFSASFPNGCTLDIGWYPSFDPTGGFGIALNQTTVYWEPFIKRECQSIDDLKKIVAELVEIAKRRPSIPQVLQDDSKAWPAHPLSDDLILDPMAPLNSQLDALREKMFWAFYETYRIRVGWVPPHSPDGEFVVTLSRAGSKYDFDGPVGVIVERRCRSISQMLAAFKELAIQAEKLDESERQKS